MVESSIKMSLKNKTLVKLNNAGFRINEKWLVQGVSLHVERGKIITLIGPNAWAPPMVITLSTPAIEAAAITNGLSTPSGVGATIVT